jgi:hypothetical protein
VRFWARSLGVGAAAGLAVGFLVGGILGRVFMRLLALAEEDALGLRTAMGAVVGDLTAGGTLAIFVFGGFAGTFLGVGYVLVRGLMPNGVLWRELLFVSGCVALLLPPIVSGNLDDFSFLPVTLSLGLIVGSVTLAAAPVPLLVERFAPDRERRPWRPASYMLVGLALCASGALAVQAVLDAYAVESLF